MTGAYLVERDEPVLPTSPIVGRLDDELAELLGGVKAFAARYADRFGTTERTAYRHLCRLRRPMAPAGLIDRFAHVLGVHPEQLYGAAWQDPGPGARGRGALASGPGSIRIALRLEETSMCPACHVNEPDPECGERLCTSCCDELGHRVEAG